RLYVVAGLPGPRRDAICAAVLALRLARQIRRRLLRLSGRGLGLPALFRHEREHRHSDRAFVPAGVAATGGRARSGEAGGGLVTRDTAEPDGIFLMLSPFQG